MHIDIYNYSSVTESCLTLCEPMDCLFKLTSTESVMPSNHLILCRPILLLYTFNLFQHQGLFQRVSSSHWVAKVLELHWRRECQATSVFLP